ncbi:Cytochrome P450 [uncultured virus]|nr:Cytochrome P450 [uncultured virus]
MSWSLHNIPAGDPIPSLLITGMKWVDACINHVCYRYDMDYHNVLGGDIYNLAEDSLLPFILRLVNNNSNKCISFRLGPKKLVLINDVLLTKSILTRKGTERDDNYNRLTEFFGYGIFTSRIKDRWRHQRNIILNLFSRKNLSGMEHPMWNTTINLIEEVKGEVIDLARFLSKLGLIIFCDLILKIDVRDMENPAIDIDETLYYINGALEPIQNIFSSRYRKFKYHRDRVHEWMREVIRRVRQQWSSEVNNEINIESDQLIREFLTGDKITDEMIELMISVILGGHETTSRLMLGISYSLLTNPNIVEKIRLEPPIVNHISISINDWPKFHKNAISSHSLLEQKFTELTNSNATYIHDVVSEALRLFPPVWLISRVLSTDEKSKEDFVYDDIIIPGGTSILISPLILQRKKELWGEDAEIFKPERFDKQSQSGGYNYTPHFFPFALGPEACPGKHFARLEAAVVIQALFRQYNIELVGPHTLHPHSMGTFRLTKDLMVRITDGA